MSEDGEEFWPHVDGLFLLVEPEERIVFSNAVTSSFRPASPEPIAMTAEVTFVSAPEGTEYRAVVRHADEAARSRHEELGFFEGWGARTAALAAIAEEAG